MVRLNLDKAANFSLKNMGYESLPVSQKVKAVKPSGSSGWYVFLVYLENNELFRSETRCRVNWGLVRGSSVGEASGGGAQRFTVQARFLLRTQLCLLASN